MKRCLQTGSPYEPPNFAPHSKANLGIIHRPDPYGEPTARHSNAIKCRNIPYGEPVCRLHETWQNTRTRDIDQQSRIVTDHGHHGAHVTSLHRTNRYVLTRTWKRKVLLSKVKWNAFQTRQSFEVKWEKPTLRVSFSRSEPVLVGFLQNSTLNVFHNNATRWTTFAFVVY